MKRIFASIVGLVFLASVALANMPGTFNPILSAPSGISPATVVYVGTVTGTMSGGATVTLTSAAIGAAAANRCVVLAVSFRTTSGGSNLASATIGGTPTTLLAVGAAGGNGASIGFFALVVPTGTTANIVINLTGGGTGATGGVGVYNIFNQTASCPAIFDSKTTITSGGTMNVNVPAGGVAIATSGDDNGQSLSWSGTGLTTNYNQTVGGAHALSGASGAYASAQTPLAVIGTSSGGGSPNFLVASWSP